MSSDHYINHHPIHPRRTRDEWLSHSDGLPLTIEEKLTDRNYRNYLIHEAVEKLVFEPFHDQPIRSQYVFYVYKWMEAVLHELSVAQAIAGACNLFNLTLVLKPTFQPIVGVMDIIDTDMYRPMIKQAMDNLTKFFLKRQEELLQKDQTLEKPSVVIKNINEIVESIAKIQKKVFVLTPIAWNALSDIFDIVRGVLQEENIDLSTYTRVDPKASTPKFILTQQELLTILSRHPLIGTELNRAAGGIMQSNLNLRDGAYSGIRKLNANEGRTIGYVLMLKAAVRKNKHAITELLHNITLHPQHFLEYYLDITVAVRDDVFGKLLIKQDPSGGPDSLDSDSDPDSDPDSDSDSDHGPGFGPRTAPKHPTDIITRPPRKNRSRQPPSLPQSLARIHRHSVDVKRLVDTLERTTQSERVVQELFNIIMLLENTNQIGLFTRGVHRVYRYLLDTLRGSRPRKRSREELPNADPDPNTDPNTDPNADPNADPDVDPDVLPMTKAHRAMMRRRRADPASQTHPARLPAPPPEPSSALERTSDPSSDTDELPRTQASQHKQPSCTVQSSFPTRYIQINGELVDIGHLNKHKKE